MFCVTNNDMCFKLIVLSYGFLRFYATGCDKGFTGPNCEYINQVFGSDITSNLGRDESRIRDGRAETCSRQTNAGSDPYIRVEFDNVIYVDEVIITFNNLTAVSEYRVYTGLSTVLDQTTLCYTDPGDVLSSNRVSVICERRFMAKYVTIQLEGSENKLELCEIEIPSGRLLSANKPTFGSEEESNRAPELAIDGQTGTYYASQFQETPYWSVDLQHVYKIQLIQMRTREDSKTFLVGFQIHVSNSSDFRKAVLAHTDLNTESTVQQYLVIPLDSTVGRFVRISVPGESRKLVIRELEVLGDCVDNYCGSDCSMRCFCADKRVSIEQKVEGTCPGECQRNWRNDNGYCNTGICSGNTFGYQCKYNCKCTGFCNPWSGQCLPQTTSCRRHHYGDGCQARNIIAGSESTLQGVGTSYNPAPVTVDGRVDTCSPELNGPTSSWFMPFETERTVDQVLIYVNESVTTLGMIITLENGESSTTCELSKLDLYGRYLGRCNSAAATYLRISTRNSMQLCEVAVLECSDGTFGPLCENTCLCVDGSPCDKTNGTCPSGGCEAGYQGDACSEECSLGFYSNNCTTRCGQCYDGEHCDIFTGECPDICAPGWQGGRCDIECYNGTYGQNCLEVCGSCYNEEPCDKVTGVCTEGCDAGFYTANCTVECPPGSFGYNCNQTCGSCNFGDICDPVNGDCLSGCVVGKYPPTCIDDCPHGTYGQGCINTCGKCRDNNTCHLITGVCDDSCAPGVQVKEVQPMCDKECPDGLYGYNCSRQCSEDVCVGGNVCDKASGACLLGCLNPGYQFPLCQSECYDGTYGLDCQSVCGPCMDWAPCNKTTGRCPAGCQRGYTGPKCLEKDPQLSAASIAVLAVGCLLAVAGLVGVLIGYWIYKKGTPPWVYVKRRMKKDKYVRDEKAPRNLSIVSRVYENNIALESDPPKLKRTNSNASNYKLSEARPRGTIAVEDFWDFVQDKKSSKQEMVQQFKDLSVGLTHPCETAKKAQNLRKNRYKEIFAYDHSRVKLDMLPGDAGNDYVNACFISGYNRPHMYIAAQGPTEEFVADFWRMIWQKKCRKIVILTRLVEHNKVKCCQYWPDDGIKQYGGVNVECKESETYADFTIRTFSISVEGKEGRLVRQFHFESWPDRHVPEYASSVVHFWNTVRTTDVKDNVPILVHCSAGIGRTGTFLSLDYLVDQANIEGYVNVFQCVQNLRHQRVNMVQNQDQYMFLHEALAEALFCPSAAVPCEHFSKTYKNMLEVDHKTKKLKLEMEFERIQCVTKFYDSMSPSFYDNSNYKAANNSANKEKNRVSHILPSDMHRPWLITRVCDRNDYINAVYLPSYRDDKMFLVTQNPLPDTIVDFWRMVYENKVSSVINLDRITNPSEVYWPKEGETLTFIPFTLHHLGETDHVTYTEISMRLQNAEEPHEKARILKVFECKFWMSEDRVPVGGESSILEVYEQVNLWQKTTGNQPIVVHCMNGATKSGLFCVVMSTLERMRQEREVALQQVLKQMRIRRHQIVPSYDQYKFCHDIIAEFIKGCDSFSNFYI
ncbi:uncharacterized protein LOC123558827 [Mercenaria mercenaria]|uniref:uncharacterized protein LOC123558827 n=1 Tax=Mercenaria mercenaria TaxID=6596 RepID=UPI00234FB11E|nr:uncharacterized protein LOC123558827 [Mercenaria mercenaria]